MRILHRRGFWPDGVLEKGLSKLGVRMDSTEGRFMSFVYEDDPAWPQLQSLFAKHGTYTDWVETEYSDADLDNAAWLEVSPSQLWGSPLPDGSKGPRWTVLTFEDSCRCGWHGRQIAPYRFKGDPPWRGKRDTLTSEEWPEDTFVKPSVWEAIESAGLTGVSKYPVLRHRDGEPLKTIVQLKVDSFLAGNCIEPDLPRHVCENGHKRYGMKEAGPLRLPASAFAKVPDFAYSLDRFGNEFWGMRKLIVSQKAARILRKAANGLEVAPLEITR